jgi:hypothetical protein
MRIAAAFVLVFLGAVAPPTPHSFRYVREVTVTDAPPGAKNACAILDAEVYAHANPLADLRLYAGGQEVPYAITFSGTAPTGDPARILNLGSKSPRHLSFDLQMPPRAYSAVSLTLDAEDFLASVRVTGLKSLSDPAPTYLGVFTLFDLTGQHLGRNTNLQLAESTFPYLHLDLAFTPAPPNHTLHVTPALVAGAEIPPSRLAQTLYTPVAQAYSIAQRGRETVATFTVSKGVPVERVRFELDPSDRTNFSRPVVIAARAALRDEAKLRTAPPIEQLSGNISRVDLTEAGQQISEEALSVPAILAMTAQENANIEVAIENGDDHPLALRGVRLEMRQRKLCFPVPPAPATLLYGAPDVAAPVYDFERIFNPAEPVRAAMLGPEQPNPLYVAPPPTNRPFFERYPQLLWVVLLGVICTLAAIAFRSAKRIL